MSRTYDLYPIFLGRVPRHLYRTAGRRHDSEVSGLTRRFRCLHGQVIRLGRQNEGITEAIVSDRVSVWQICSSELQ